MDFLLGIVAVVVTIECLGGALANLLGTSSDISDARYQAARAEEEQRRAYARYREQQLAQEHYKTKQEGDA